MELGQITLRLQYHVTLSEYALMNFTANLLVASPLLCIADVNECENDPCHNDGLCVNMPGSFQCRCQGGFTGELCETGIIVIYLLFDQRKGRRIIQL